jgi:hypothetical protein
MSKGKDVTTELLVLESARRDEIFQSDLSIDKIKELSSIIFMCIASGKSDEDITRLTGLSQSQIDYVKTRPEYYRSIHQMDNDAGLTRTLLRAHKVEVTEALINEAKKGNCKAIQIYFDKVDKTDDASNSLQAVYYDLMKRLGIMTNNQQATKRIQSSKEANAILELEASNVDSDGVTIEQDINSDDETIEDFSDETPEEYRVRVLKGLMTKG